MYTPTCVEENVVKEIMGQEFQFLIFVGSTQMQFLNISSVFLALLESLFFAFFHVFFVVSDGPRPTQPNPTSQPSPAQPGQLASQPTHPKITNSVSICVKRSKNRLSEWYPKSPEAELCTPKGRPGDPKWALGAAHQNTMV